MQPGKGRGLRFAGLPCWHPGTALLVLFALLAAGCAGSGGATDDAKYPVLYGGVSSGVSRP